MRPKIEPCLECGEPVVLCDNSVWLNVPPVEWREHGADWVLAWRDGRVVAVNDAVDLTGRAHTLHEHQPRIKVNA